MITTKESQSSPTKQGGNRNFSPTLTILFLFVVLQVQQSSTISTSLRTVQRAQQQAHQAQQAQQEQQQTLPPKEKERVDIGYLTNGTAIFKEVAESHDPTTDKVTDHTYHVMYGTHLLPYYHQHPEMKMLEIGLGCDMRYGPGASVRLWKELFPEAELWEAEYNENCVQRSRARGQLDGLHVLVGDQGDPSVLDRWIQRSKGNFDVVIDDGGHTQCQIWTSFEKLWPTVKPGGLYFIEDLQVANVDRYRKSSPSCDGTNLSVPSKLKEIMDTLLYSRPREGDVEFLLCQPEACVVKKRP